jgi:hypothetical protein
MMDDVVANAEQPIQLGKPRVGELTDCESKLQDFQYLSFAARSLAWRLDDLDDAPIEPSIA